MPENNLDHYLALRAPGSATIPNERVEQSRLEDFDFVRERLVEINWDEAAGDSRAPLPHEITTLLTRWGSVPEGAESPPIPQLAHQLSADNPRVALRDKLVELTRGFVLEDPFAKREYLLIPEGGAEFTVDDFVDASALRSALEQKLASLEIVFRTQEEAERDSGSEVEVIDLAAPRLLRAAEELDILEEFTKKNVASAREWLAQLERPLLEPREKDAVFSSYRSALVDSIQVDELRKRLKDQARDLGYRLVKAGEKWQLRRPVRVRRVFWGWAGIRPAGVRWVSRRSIGWVLRHRFGVWRRYRWIRSETTPVEVDLDPWVERQQELEDRGFNVFRFVEDGDQLRTPEGTDLSEVLEQCEQSEQFRNSCAIMLPAYEESLLGRRELASYTVVVRPLPNYRAQDTPSVLLQEGLRISRAWVGTELGELLNNIGLAPGEKRTMRLEQRYSRRQELTSTSTSILEIGESETADYSQTLEKEMRKETGVTRSRGGSSGFNVGISYAGVGVGFGSKKKKSRSKSTSQFTRELETIERKTSRSFDASQRVELSSTVTSEVSTERTRETEIEVENINRSTSLNLALHQLRNVYKSVLALTELSIVVTSSYEMLPGTDFVETTTIPLRDVDRLLELPLLSPGRVVGSGVRREDYFASLLRNIYRQVQNEYSLGADEKCLLSPARLSLNVDDATPKELIDALKGIADDLVERASVIHAWRSSIASPAIRMESTLGTTRALDDYATEMRLAEIGYRRAQATALTESRSSSETVGNVIAGFAVLDDRKVTIMAERTLADGRWELRVNENVRGEALVRGPRSQLSFSWQEAQPWLAELRQDPRGKGVNLRHVDSGEILWHRG